MRSALTMFLAVFAEIEGLAFIAMGLIAQRGDIFIQSQQAVVPASAFVAGSTTAAVIWHEIAKTSRTRRRAELAQRLELSLVRERVVLHAGRRAYNVRMAA